MFNYTQQRLRLGAVLGQTGPPLELPLAGGIAPMLGDRRSCIIDWSGGIFEHFGPDFRVEHSEILTEIHKSFLPHKHASEY